MSEKTDFNDFNDSSALIWTKLDLWYGDFYSGENQDGTYSFSTTLTTSEVNYKARMHANLGFRVTNLASLIVTWCFPKILGG